MRAIVDRQPAGTASPPRRRVTAIVNPATRRDVVAATAALRRATPPEVDLDVRVTSGPGDGVRLAREAAAAASIVVAVGGDGTVAEVATGLHGHDLPLGILPAGSTNIVARDLGIPTDLRAAAALIFGPHRHATVDVGRCGDRSFLHMAGAGLDGRFFERTDRALKRRVGWLAYLPAAAVSLRLPPARFEIVADDRTIRVTSSLVLVANGGSIIAPGLRLHPEISPSDGWLDLLVFTATAPVPVARTLVSLAARRLASSPYLLAIKAKRIELSSEPPMAVQLDGDVVGSTPIVVMIEPRALRIIAVPTAPTRPGTGIPRRSLPESTT